MSPAQLCRFGLCSRNGSCTSWASSPLRAHTHTHRKSHNHQKKSLPPSSLLLPTLQSFSAEIQIPEARAFYAFQAAIETVHSEMYGRLLETYILDARKRRHLFRAIQTIPCVRESSGLGAGVVGNLGAERVRGTLQCLGSTCG